MDKRRWLLQRPSIGRKRSKRSCNTVPRSTLRVKCKIHRNRPIAARVKAKVGKHPRLLMPTRRVLRLQVPHRPATTADNAERVADNAERVAGNAERADNAVAKREQQHHQ